MTADPHHIDTSAARRREALDELARQRGVRPVRSVDDMAVDGIFATDEEVDAFLEQVYALRRADLA